MLFKIRLFELMILILSIRFIRSQLNQKYCQCKVFSNLKRSYGGKKVNANELNFVANLFYKKKVLKKNIYEYGDFCAANLLNPVWLISSGQCLSYMQKKSNVQYYAAIGSDHDQYNTYFNKQNYREILRYFLHPNYVSGSNLNNIGLIKLKSSFKLGKQTNIYAVCLDANDEMKFKTNYLAAGFGMANYFEKPSNEFKNLPSNVQMNVKKRYLIQVYLKKYYENINSNKCSENKLICARNEKSSPCLADSGGSLLATDNEKKNLFLIGILSASYPSIIKNNTNLVICGSNQLTISNPISSNYEWIKNHTGNQLCHKEKFYSKYLENTNLGQSTPFLTIAFWVLFIFDLLLIGFIILGNKK